MLIPGWLIAILTFPGVIVHEIGHKFFCDRLGVKVSEVKYFRIGNPAGYVIHEIPKKFYQTFLIDVGPFIVNSIVAIAIFAAVGNIPYLNVGIIWLILMWLGVSIGMHAFPSTHDAKVLWNESKRYVVNKNLIALIGFPISALIYIANVLSVVWFDLIYAIGLYALVTLLILPSSYSIFEETPQLFESEKCGFSIGITSFWDADSDEDNCYFVFDKNDRVILIDATESGVYESLDDYIKLRETLGAFTFTEIIRSEGQISIGSFRNHISGTLCSEGECAEAEFFDIESNGRYYVVAYLSERGELDEIDSIYSFKVK